MFQQAPSYLTAFFAGLLSFLTPCVLPLVPGYLSFISGVSLEELSGRAEAEGAGRRRRAVLLSTLMFVTGFSIVFILTGLTAFAVGQAMAQYKEWLIRVAGVVVIVLGLHMAGGFRIGKLYQEKRFQGGRGGSLPRAFILGLAFAFGWTPCIGPILGGIWGLAMNQDRFFQALALMALYSAGLAIPFILTGLAVETFFKAFDRVKAHFHIIEVGAGILLVVIGLFMVVNKFTYLKALFDYILPEAVKMWG
mgnify:CR=1 FL=1